MPDGMPTPWGVAQTQQLLTEDVHLVHTTDCGGILVALHKAEQLLSERARTMGRHWHDFLAFGQEDAMMVVLYEHPELYPWVEEELTELFAEDLLRRQYPFYFNA